jgi:colanic acid biosynthesis glycosyl transferase WcaI
MDLAGDASKIIKEAGCGFALPPEDANLLSEAILKLHEDDMLCALFGNNGRNYAEEHFSLYKAAENFENIFLSIVKN